MIGMIERTVDTLAQDVDAMWEADAAAEWERINECESDNYPNWCNAESKLGQAMSMLCKVEEMLNIAADYVAESSQEDRIMSLVDQVNALYDAVYDQKKRMEVL